MHVSGALAEFRAQNSNAPLRGVTHDDRAIARAVVDAICHWKDNAPSDQSVASMVMDFFDSVGS